MKDYFNRGLCLAFCLFLSTHVFAEDVTVGYLTYSFQGNSATIIGYEASSIPQDLIIPETVSYNGLNFTVTGIGNSAFKGCTQIHSLNMTKSLSIGNSAFYQCSNLVSVNIITNSISPYTFQYCSNLESVTLHEVVDIYNDAFSYCPKIKWIDFGDNLKRIGSGAFRQCNSLTYIVIPATVTYLCQNQYKSANHYTSMGDESYWGNLADMTKYPLSEYTYAPFDECNYIQTVIYLGNYVATGLNNVNCYYPNSLLTWNSTEFNFTGSAPTPTYTNHLPAGFQPTYIPSLEKNVGSYSTTIPITFTNKDMSFTADIPCTYTINPVTLTAKVIDASREYGDVNPQFTSTYTGFVNNEDASVLTSQGTYTTTATEKSDVGTYTIKQTGATAQNYVFEYEDGTLTVNKAPLTMTANDKTMTYGNPIPTLDVKYEGLKNNETVPAWNNEPSISTLATSASKVGTYPISISNADAKNYQLTVNNGTLTIDKAELTVKADDKSRTYGEADPDFTLSYTGLKNNETVPEWEKQPAIETASNVKSPVGTYPITIKDAIAVNYNITSTDGTLTINKAELQVTPKDATKKYGEDNPNFELSYVGLKNNESAPEWIVEPIITTNATTTSNVGEYAVQITSAEARNYTLDMKVGTLTITKAALTIGVNNYSRKYGEANPSFEISYNGLLNGENTPEWTELPSITTEATEKSDVGEYAIVATGGIMKNYEATQVTPGVLTITPAPLTLRANDVNRLYYEDNPAFSFKCTGFIGNDDSSVFTTMPTIKTKATQNSSVGVYPIEISGAETKNYDLSYENGQLTITKRQLAVSTKNYTREYGEENPVFEIRYKGFVNNEDESVLIVKPKATTEATETSDVGDYDIVLSNGVAENYDFQYTNGKLTIEKAYQTLSWNQDFSDIKQYDQVELTAVASSGLEVTYSVQGSQICSITKIGKKQYLDCFGTGEAVIVAIQEGNNNYWQTPKSYKAIVINNSSTVKELPGDANSDQAVDVADVVAIVNYILGEPNDPFVEAAADVNGDGKIDVDDVVAVVNIILDSGQQNAREMMRALKACGFRF